MGDGPIFIVGHERSGTTLLRLMLCEHPRIDLPPESAFVSLLLRRQARGLLDGSAASVQRVVGEMCDHTWIAKSWIEEQGVTREEILARAAAGEADAAGILRSLLSFWSERAGKPRWGEKAPRNYRHLRAIGAWFDDARVLHIVRDGRDVAVSMLTPPVSEMHDHGNEYEVALRWRDALRQGAAAAGFLGSQRYLELRYEDLTADPEAVLRSVCAFLQEDYDAAMLQFSRRAGERMPARAQPIHQRLKKKVDRQRVGRWREEASRAFVSAFEHLAGAELVRHGYDLSGWAAPVRVRLRAALEPLRPRRLDRHYVSPAERRRRRRARQQPADR